MSPPLSMVILDDPTAGLTKYRAFLTYLKDHDDIPLASKFEIQLLLSMSRRLQTLQTTYAGLFHMEETEVSKIKSMRGYIIIMLKKFAPNLSVKFEQNGNKFTLSTTGAMVEPVPSTSSVKGPTTAKETVFESEDTDLDSQLEKDMMAVAEKMESDRLGKEDNFHTPVRHVHTEQSESTTSSVTTKNSTYATMTASKATKMSAHATEVTPVKQTTILTGIPNETTNSTLDETGKDPTINVRKETEQKDQDSPIYAFVGGNAINMGTFSTNQSSQSQGDMTDKDEIVGDTVRRKHESLVVPPTTGNATGNATKIDLSHGSSDGFTLVTEGVKQASQEQTGATKSVTSTKGDNFYEILNTENDPDEPLNRQQESEDTRMSPILLQPHQQSKSGLINAIRDNIATSPKSPQPKPTSATTQKSPATKKPTATIPGTFSVGDKKFRDKHDGFNAIEEHLTHNNHHLVSLNDLAWYITTAKPRIGHIRGQVRSECESIQKQSIQECRTASTKAVDFATMKMSRIADVECNKLNSTSHKIFQELDKAKIIMTQMTSLHDMCAAMVKSTTENPHQFATRAEQAQTQQKCKDSVLDMVNEVTRVEAKLRVLQSEVTQLKDTQTNPPDKKPIFATDPNRLQDQIDYLRQRVNQTESEISVLQRLVTGTDSNTILVDKQEYEELQRDMKEMKADIVAIKGAHLKPPATPPRHKLFPHVDPSTIAQAAPSPTPRSSHFPVTPQPPVNDPPLSRMPTPGENTIPVREQLLPYGQRLIVNNSGCATECWIRKCYQRIGQPNEYEAVTCGGDHIKFHRKEVIIDDFEPSHTTHVPHDYVVTITGGYDTTPDVSNHALKMEYQDDTDDISTASHNSYRHHHAQQQTFRPNNRRYNHLAHNAFVYPLGGVPKIIREEKAGTAGKDFTGHLAAHEDPRNFYTQIRQTLLAYQVLLRAYVAITKTNGLLEITEDNCQNYHSAKLVMSRFLYIFFFHGRDTMFDNNNYARFSLVNYEEHQDGLTFLLNLIRERHPKLRSDVNRSSISKALELPRFEDTITIWEYIAKCQIYIKDVQPSNCTQVDVLRIVQEQISKDPRFKIASDHLQAQISTLKNGNGSVPPEYNLKNLTQTIMECYELNDRERLSQPRRPARIAAFETPVEIQRVQQKTSHQQRNNDRGTAEDKNQNDHKEKFCKSCITYGHTDEECTKTGAAISIAQYLQTCSSEKKRQILAAYRENRKAAHTRYLAAYERRKDLKKKIRRIHYDYLLSPRSNTDPQAEQTFEMLRVACVKTAQAEHPDLDFGSIDANYDDIEEPVLQFDPTTDVLPHEDGL